MPEPNDMNHAGEIFRKSMEEALAHLDQAKEDLLKQQEKAIDDQIAAKEEFNRIQHDAHRISEAYIDTHRKEIEQRIRDEAFLDVTRKLILSGIPSNTLKGALSLDPKILADAWMYLGFEKLDEHHVGHVAYDGSRSGDVIFYREDLVVHFPFEFAGEDTLAYIRIPPPEIWVASTGMSMEERMPVLEFIAKRIIRDQARNCHFEITPDAIYIKY